MTAPLAGRSAGGPPTSAAITPAEHEVTLALDALRPDLAVPYARRLPDARAGVLGRLWGALLRERLPGTRVVAPAEEGVALGLPDGSRLVGPVAGCPFGPHPGGLAVTAYAADGRQGTALTHPVDLLAALRLPDPDGRVARLGRELAGSVANLALARTVADERRLLVGPAADSGGATADALVFALERTAADPTFSSLAFFEQSVVDGHPLHPCCRTREPMNAAELLDFAPECGRAVPLAVVAVRRDRYRGHGRLDVLLRAAPRVDAAVRAALSDPDGHALLPVHPWQLLHVLLPHHREAFGSEVLTVLPGCEVPARPLMSLRTLEPVGPVPAYHLKLAVSAQMTSAVRTVSPAAVHNGPTLSALLAEILRRERGFGGRIGVLAEPASGYYVDGVGQPVPALAAVAREPVHRHVLPGEVPMPVAALSAPSPVGAGPVLADALRAADTDARGWLAAYCRLTLPPLFTLLTRWGVALEAHAQNCVVVLRDGWPVRLLYRDFGGVRVSPNRLGRHGLAPPPLHGGVPADDPEVLRTKLLASLLVTHVAELVSSLARAGGTDEDPLWTVVAGAARAAHADLAGEPDAAADAAAIFADTLPCKAVLRMRLAADPVADLWVPVPNPLAGRS